ncbi:NADH-quinone oxidoreductase subunit NuoE family protein [Christensenella tenuis]|jgi:NADH:ubiquinone oxidoreductase subunit E|uniref:NAD(P)H-dependent oxidoreductase subunit E n=1 Tax=Christensenella tenuis TaxID=2763033 RepID=A0ABR7EBJ6_9FIRM|nr:NAD(P)H-dependent oxidoreductase subunit E [Christensenella tenuis]MBC5647033.1 NAD(P)H-dependent oxidoreductase subunit E [Christensenella tenuis]
MGNTAELQVKFDELKGYISETMKKPGPLMPIMQKAQDIFGSLPFEVQKFISEEMQIPMTDIYGVATFYSQFALEPKGKHVIGVCMGTACYVKKAESILNALGDELQTAPGGTTPDALFTLEATRCLGCCGLAPVIMIDDQVYGRLKPEDIPGIIGLYRDKQ